MVGGVGESEDVDFGAEDFGHSGCRCYLLAGVDIDADGDHDALEVLVEVESLTYGEDGDGGFLYNAYGGAAHPVFLESGGAVGADNHHGGVFVACLTCQNGTHATGTDLPTNLAVEEVGLMLLAKVFQFLFSEEGHDGLLLFVHQHLFAFGPDNGDATLHFVGYVDRQLQSHVRTFGKVRSNND